MQHHLSKTDVYINDLKKRRDKNRYATRQSPVRMSWTIKRSIQRIIADFLQR
jgi:hypothetical protein